MSSSILVHSINKETISEKSTQKIFQNSVFNGANIGPNLLVLVPVPQILATGWKHREC